MPDELARLRDRVQVLATQIVAVDASDGEVYKAMLHELAGYHSLDLVVLDGHPLDDLRVIDRARRRRLQCILRDEPGWRQEALRATLATAKALIRDVERVSGPDLQHRSRRVHRIQPGRGRLHGRH